MKCAKLVEGIDYCRYCASRWIYATVIIEGEPESSDDPIENLKLSSNTTPTPKVRTALSVPTVEDSNDR